MVFMDAKTQLKVDIIAKVSEGKISLKNAAKLLNKSRRSIERYLSSYRKSGLIFAVHKNSFKCPSNKINIEIKLKVQKLIKNKYFDFNLAHLKEKLESDEYILVKRETLRTWAHEIHHVKREKKRRPKARKRRDRMESRGLLLQMDGSHHNWFGNNKSCLIALIDDANSELYGEFFNSESTLGCMKVIKDLILLNGKFQTLYVDRAGIFGGPKRCLFSQVQRACEEFGIQIIFANSAQGKGRIERSFDTLQDRLIPELRINNINTMKKANNYLKEKFIPNYWNKKIQIIPKNKISEYIKINKNEINLLDSTFVIKYYRKINNDHTFSYNGKSYSILSKLKASISGYKIEIRHCLDGKEKYFFSGRELNVFECKNPSRPDIDEIEAKNRIRAVSLSIKLNSVSKASKTTGVSRQIIYRTSEILKNKSEQYFIENFNKNSCLKSAPKFKIEKIVVNFSIKNPHLGEDQAAKHIRNKFKIEISSGTIRNIWLRNNMETIALRIIASKN